MKRDSPRELATDIEQLTDALERGTAQDFVDTVLAGGWDFCDDPDTDRKVRLLDADGWVLFVDRDELPPVSCPREPASDRHLTGDTSKRCRA